MIDWKKILQAELELNTIKNIFIIIYIMNNKFFIEDGHLSFKMSENVIKKYFYIEGYETTLKY